MKMPNDWVQKAIERPGRVRRYLKRKYGNKAFYKNGKIKIKYLDIEIRRLKNKKNKTPQELSLYRALLLAKQLKKMKGRCE